MRKWEDVSLSDLVTVEMIGSVLQIKLIDSAKETMDSALEEHCALQDGNEKEN